MIEIVNELAINVRDAILSHESFNENWQIDLKVKSNVITLLGSVPTDNEKNIAEAIVKKQDGVMSVVNELRIGDRTANHEIQTNHDLDSDPNPIRILTPRR